MNTPNLPNTSTSHSQFETIETDNQNGVPQIDHHDVHAQDSRVDPRLMRKLRKKKKKKQRKSNVGIQLQDELTNSNEHHNNGQHHANLSDEYSHTQPDPVDPRGWRKIHNLLRNHNSHHEQDDVNLQNGSYSASFGSTMIENLSPNYINDHHSVKNLDNITNISDSQRAAFRFLHQFQNPLLFRSSRYLDTSNSSWKQDQLYTPFGLSTKGASEILTKEVKALFKSLSRDKLSWIVKAIFELGFARVIMSVIMHICFFLLLAGTIMRWYQYATNDSQSQSLMTSIRLTIEVLLFLLASIICDSLILLEAWKKYRGSITTLRMKVSAFLKDASDFDPGDSYRYSVDSMHSVATFRDGRWVRLPYCLLVKGDVMYSRFPKEHFEQQNLEYEAIPNCANCYLLKGSVLPRLLEVSLPPQMNDPRRPIHSTIRLFIKPFAILLILTLLLSYIIFGPLLLTRLIVYNWVDFILIIPVYLSLFLLPVGFPIVWVLIHVMAKATLATVQSVYMQAEHVETISSPNQKRQIKTPKTLFFKYFAKFAFRIFDPALDDVFHLGNISNLCCVNTDGILANPDYTPIRIFMVTPADVEASHSNSLQDIGTNQNSEVYVAEGDKKVENDWREYESEHVRDYLNSQFNIDANPRNYSQKIEDTGSEYENNYNVQNDKQSLCSHNESRLSEVENEKVEENDSLLLDEDEHNDTDGKIITYDDDDATSASEYQFESTDKRGQLNSENAKDEKWQKPFLHKILESTPVTPNFDDYNTQQNSQINYLENAEEGRQNNEDIGNIDEIVLDKIKIETNEMNKSNDHAAEADDMEEYANSSSQPKRSSIRDSYKNSQRAPHNGERSLEEDISELEHGSTALRNSRPATVLLDLLYNAETRQFTFQDSDWEEYLSLLKAIGFSFLISFRMMPELDLSAIDDDLSYLWKPYLYQLSRQIGFEEDILEKVVPRMKISTRRQQLHFVSRVIKFEGAGFQLHSYGHPEILLEYCSDYFDGYDIRPITQEVREQLLMKHNDWEDKQNLLVVAFSYKPVDVEFMPLVNTHLNRSITIEDDLVVDQSSTEFQFLQMQHSQIFLGMTAFQKKGLQYLPELLQILADESGIRFSYYSKKNLFSTKAFGQTLGLETSWNSCISLSDPSRPVQLDSYYKNARLPVGIEALKKHIQEVDDVPLSVSLFCDVTPKSIGQMIKILQENNEMVCCVGSSTTVNNLPLFSQADIAVAVDPHASQVPDHTLTKQYDSLKQLASAPCSFRIPESSSKDVFKILFHLIRECRRQVANIQQSFMFLVGANLCLYLIQAIGILFLFPVMVNGLQAFWMMLVIIPLISSALMSNQTDPKVMTYITLKRPSTRGWKDLFFTFVELLLRFFIPIPLCIIINVWTVLTMAGVSANVGSLTNYWFGRIPTSYYNTKSFDLAVLYGQNFMLFYLILHFCFISMGYMSEIHSIFRMPIWRNLRLLLAMLVVVTLQIIFTVVQITLFHAESNVPNHFYPNLPFYFYLIFIIFIPLNLVIPELLKIRKRKRFTIAQTKERLHFETRLGMHSPT